MGHRARNDQYAEQQRPETTEDDPAPAGGEQEVLRRPEAAL